MIPFDLRHYGRLTVNYDLSFTERLQKFETVIEATRYKYIDPDFTESLFPTPRTGTATFKASLATCPWDDHGFSHKDMSEDLQKMGFSLAVAVDILEFEIAGLGSPNGFVIALGQPVSGRIRRRDYLHLDRLSSEKRGLHIIGEGAVISWAEHFLVLRRVS